MRNRLHSIHAYAEYDVYIDRVERYIKPNIFPILGCDEKIVLNRVLQRVVELSLGPFVKQFARFAESDKSNLNLLSKNLNLDGIVIDANSGDIHIKPMLLLRLVIDFMKLWLLGVYSILCTCAGSSRGKATLLLGIGVESIFQDGSDKRFTEFCIDGPISPLKEAERIIVQHSTFSGSCSDARVSYARYPYAQLAREIRLGWINRIVLLCQHLLVPILYAFATIRFRPLALLSRDFALEFLMRSLDSNKMIECVVFTNSNYTSQPMWARSPRTYDTHMVWYSQNAMPLLMKGDEFKKDLPNYRFMQIDIHWVWTSGFREHLLNHFGLMRNVEVVGPVMWQLPELTKRKDFRFKITVFDVTPITDAYALSVGLLANYYNSTNSIKFLEGIINNVAILRDKENASCLIQLKHKRAYSNFHDLDYIKLVSDLNENGELLLVPFDINIFQLIEESDVIIVVPNSSPAYIGSWLGKPVVYFDPTAELQPTFEEAEGILFASGESELKQHLLSIYSKKNSIPEYD